MVWFEFIIACYINSVLGKLSVMRQRLECYLRFEGYLLIGDIRTTDGLFNIIWCEAAIAIA